MIGPTMIDRFVELGLESSCPVRELRLIGGPAAGGLVSMPEKGTGEFVIRHLPLQIEEFQNAEGDWDYHVLGGGGTTDPTTGEPLGAMIYVVDAGADTATFVRSDHNPTSEDDDDGLTVEAPYLENPALPRPKLTIVGETATGDDA